MIPRRAQRLALLALAGAGPLALSGCASLDPRPDIQHAADIVRDRTGVLPPWLSPDDEPLPARLDERTAATLALRHDARMLQDLEHIAQARADLVQSGLLPNPVLAFSLGFPFDGSGGPTQIGVGLTQQLTALLTRDARMTAADADLRARVLDCSDRALRTAADARAAHARVLFAQRALDALRAAAGEAEQAVAQARKRVQAGEDTSLEVNRQLLAQLKLRAEIEERAGTLELRRRDLLRRIGHAESTAELQVVPDAPNDAPNPTEWTEAQVIDRAKRDRLDIAAAAAAADAARNLLRAERRSRLDWSAGAEFERTDEGRRQIGPTLEVGIPVFDWGDARVAKRAAQARVLDLEHTRIAQDAIAEARAALLTERTARSLVQRYESEVATLAAANLDLARRARGAGQSDVTVLLEAQQQVADARVRVVDLQERAALARIDLQRALGGGRE